MKGSLIVTLISKKIEDRNGNSVDVSQVQSRFNTAFQRFWPKSFSPSGQGTKKTYSVQYDQFGNRSLVQTGEVDNYAIIQSFKDECDVCRLIEKYQQGDLSALARVQAVYCDTTVYPHSLMEARNSYSVALEAYDLLSDEAKAYYGSPEQFLTRLHEGDVFTGSSENSDVGGTENE